MHTGSGCAEAQAIDPNIRWLGYTKMIVTGLDIEYDLIYTISTMIDLLKLRLLNYSLTSFDADPWLILEPYRGLE